MSKSKPLFPYELEQGSEGVAVNVLGLILKILEYDTRKRPIVLDGEYTPGGAIASAVNRFQKDAGLVPRESEGTGNFGPMEKLKLKEICGLDVDTLTVDMFTAQTIGTVD